MTTNYHTPIVNADPRKNDAAIWNDVSSTIDTQLSANSTELETARGSYPSIGARFDGLVLAGGNVATLTSAEATAGQAAVDVDSTTGFLESGRVSYTLASGTMEYNVIESISGPTQFLLGSNIGTGGIPNNTLITMISESEYQASQAINSGGIVTATLPAVVGWLDREINVQAFGAYGDGSNHVIGSGAPLTAAQAAFPLTHAEFTITAADEYDWCAIQEAVLTAGTVTDIAVEDVYIPAGSYQINRTITVPLVSATGRTMKIRGGGQRGSGAGTLIAPTGSITMFHIPGLTQLHNLALVGYTHSNPDSIGIRIGGLTSEGDYFDQTNCVQVQIDNVRFLSGFYDCIHSVYECDHLRISNCYASGDLGRAVVYLANDHSADLWSPSAGVVIDSCHLTQNASVISGDNLYGIYLKGTEDSAIRNCVIRGYDNCIYLTGETGVRNNGLVIEGIHSEPSQELKDYLTERWIPNTAYSVGDLIRPAPAAGNGWWYKCTTLGTTPNVTTPAASASSIRCTAFRWVISARGTNEYYCELAAGGDPSLAQPFGVMVNGSPYIFAFAGALSAGTWGYGNNDSLGFNTIYIRLDDDSDPDGKASHYIWTSSQEPTWPTTYGATVTSGTAVFTAYKQSIVLAIGASNSSINGGLSVSSVWCDGFASFIQMDQTGVHDTARVTVRDCTIRACDMVYVNRAQYRSAIIFENSHLEGSIRPFAALTESSTHTSVLSRFCYLIYNYAGTLGSSIKGVASWFTNEPTYSFDSDEQPSAHYQIDPRTHSQVTVSTGSDASAVTVYVPLITSNAFIAGLRGKTITITHGAGDDGLTVSFPSAHPLLSGDAAVTSLSLPDIGDSVTIRPGIIAGGTVRWTVVGSHGI